MTVQEIYKIFAKYNGFKNVDGQPNIWRGLDDNPDTMDWMFVNNWSQDDISNFLKPFLISGFSIKAVSRANPAEPNKPGFNTVIDYKKKEEYVTLSKIVDISKRLADSNQFNEDNFVDALRQEFNLRDDDFMDVFTPAGDEKKTEKFNNKIIYWGLGILVLIILLIFLFKK